MATSPAAIKKFESKIPRVSNCCFCFDMNAGGSMLSIFGIVTGCAYLARSFYVLYNPHTFEKQQEDDDTFNNDDDAIWLFYISLLFCGFLFLITSGFMLYGSATRMSHHVFPFLVGILFSSFWAFLLGLVEVFDSDMLLACGYFAFAVLQIYLWVCAVSLYRDLLENELDPNKPTRTTV